jgi:hypothetical protein
MREQLKNRKGIIAETYHDLQALGALEKASSIYKTKNVSTWSVVKAILQGTEIFAQNLNQLLLRIIKDLKNKRISDASIKLAWFKDLNHLIVKLTNTYQLVVNEELKTNPKSILQIPSIIQLEVSLKKFDTSIKKYVDDNNIALDIFLESEKLNNELYKLLHDYRIIAYELTIWNKSLKALRIPYNTLYEIFIGLELITKAVNEPRLKGDTFFTQFRCLHQIPEILTVVVNNYIEQAIKDLRSDNLDQMHKHLKTANILFEIAVDSLRPIVENLSHNDYHEIRENLGLTSGSHSVNLHFHLFRDLYGIITSEFMSKFFLDKKKYMTLISKKYSLKLVEEELLKLRNLVNQWRNLHLHLPRINLGENQTKSLVGAKEAVESAKKMQSVANSKDPLNALANLYTNTENNEPSSLVSYIESENSFDTTIGKLLGSITQKRFLNVQNREGVFSQPLIFKNPSKRKV